MALLLSIETSTAVCSVALSENGKLIALKETKEGMKHASQLTVFIQSILKENNNEVVDLDAIVISKGPGSYTGLRIGVSTAKGLCYGANIPLIAINTLECMSVPVASSISSKLNNASSAWFCPMIDARRMEVFTAFFNNENSIQKETSADIIDENSYLDILAEREIVFFGDGSSKCKEMINHKNAIFIDNITPSAANMIGIADDKFNKAEFEDVAYFEPFYLKDFVATTPKKNILK